MDEERILAGLNRKMERMIQKANLASREEFDNLSSTDIYNLLYKLFEEESCVQFKNELTNNEYEQIPFLRLFQEYLRKISELGELKLTGKGNLPKKICVELYGLGIIKDEYIESGIVKLHREIDSVVIQNLKILGQLSGLTKKRNNKTSLTKKGLQLLNDKNSKMVFEEIFKVNIHRFNWGFHDGYTEDSGMQTLFGYTLYLMLRYGKEKRSLDFYVEKNLKAFPQELDVFEEGYGGKKDKYRSCYYIRVFKRLLDYYGFVEIQEKSVKGVFKKNIEVKTTPLFRKTFKLDTRKYRFRKPLHSA